MINVTKTFLPPIEEYHAILKRAWDAGWITNRGQLVLELEEKLKKYLGVSNIICMTNGTLPLQIAIKALGLKGEIITTPFSYVATTSSIVWEGCTPVFVDIHPQYLTIDETKLEEAITDQTSAILATHVYGNPCNVEAIDVIAKKYGLKVIYDAAHCFGVTYKGQSIFKYGDISTCSFHATKLFHTGEGGALFTTLEELENRFFFHHNFGHNGHDEFYGLGINAKMSELQAAMGLAVFPYIFDLIEKRKAIFNNYNTAIKLKNEFILRDNTIWNYGYYPFLVESDELRDSIVNNLNRNNIFPRKYFSPSLDQLPYTRSRDCNVSQSVSNRILCLPFSHDLSEASCKLIVEIINKS